MKTKYVMEWSPVTGPEAGKWFGRPRTWKTQLGALRAADRWKADMAAGGLEIKTRVNELIPVAGPGATILLPDGSKL